MPMPMLPRRRRGPAIVLLLLAALTAASLLSVALLLAELRDLPGRIDALLVSCPPCRNADASGGGAGGNDERPAEEECENNVADGGGGEGDLRSRLLWRFIRAVLLPPGCDLTEESAEDHREEPCEEDEGVRLCRICDRYRRARSHVRARKLILGPGWWIRCQLRSKNVTVTSEPGTFVERPMMTSASSGRSGKMGRIGSIILGASGDVLGLDVVDAAAANTNAAAVPPETCVERTPPPAIEIDDLRIGWRSWRHPVVDVRASGVAFNLVVGMNKTEPLGIPLPVVTVGDTPLDEAIELIPDPPEEEGRYPRFGVIDVTDVKVHFLASSDRGDCSDQGKDSDELLVEQEAARLAKILVPDEYFGHLLVKTASAGAEGIDQVHFGSVVENAIKDAVRSQVLREEEFRDMFDHVIDVSEMVKKVGLEKLKDGMGILDAFISEGRTALHRAWQDWKNEWKERNQRAGLALKRLDEKWGKSFQHSIHFEAPHLDKFLDDWANGLREFKAKSTADWKLVLPKIAEEWKKGWMEVEQVWTKIIAAPHIDVFLREVKEDLKRLQLAFKEKMDKVKK